MAQRTARNRGRFVRSFPALGALAIWATLAVPGPPLRAATLDVAGGLATYTASAAVANSLTIFTIGGVYTIDDPGEASIALTGGASGAGCSTVDANTANCPESAVTSFAVSLQDSADTANLAGAPAPVTISGGTGNDLLIGGSGDDAFTWIPGEGSDTIGGQGGSDALVFTASGAAEIIDVIAEGTGFDLLRNVGGIVIDADAIETLQLQTVAGDDLVHTVPLRFTTQLLDGGDLTNDTLDFDAGGRCVTVTSGAITGPGFGSVFHSAFEQVNVLNDCVPLFTDGFESGDTSAWSASIP